MCLNKSQPRIYRKYDVYNYSTYTYVHTLFIDTHQNIYRNRLYYFLILVRWFYVIIEDSICFEFWFLTWIVSRNVLWKPMYIHLLFINMHVSHVLFLSPSVLSFNVPHTISCKDNKYEQEKTRLLTQMPSCASCEIFHFYHYIPANNKFIVIKRIICIIIFWRRCCSSKHRSHKFCIPRSFAEDRERKSFLFFFFFFYIIQVSAI